MIRTTAHAGVSALVLGGVSFVMVSPAAAGEGHDGGGGEPVVVLEGLDNPRQLNWGPGRTLLVAEAGSGGDTCVSAPPEQGGETLCAGQTAGVTAVDHPHEEGAEGSRVVDGLFSLAGPDGSFAIGANGADATDLPGEYVVAEGNFPFAPLPPELTGAPGGETLGHLVVVETDGGQQFVIPYADLVAAEEQQNPDGAQNESNPYAVLFVDPTPDGPEGEDGYALVADAAANTVWKVEPDFAAVPEDCVDEACIPPYEVTPFAAYPTPPDDDVTPEFVPTALATDEDGNIYVGGLGSEIVGAAEVRQYTADGEEIGGWGGFTGITGLAVDESGEHLYVSQLFGSNPEAPPADPAAAPGNVVEVDVDAGTYRSADVPFPGGVAVDEDGHVFVAAYSVAPAEGVAAGPESPAFPGGQVWEIFFSEDTEQRLPVVFPLDTGGEWVAAQPVTSPLPEYCGGIFLTSGDQRGEWRVTRDEEGDRIEYRGAATLDILGPDFTVLVDELNVSGEGFEFHGVDGSAQFEFDGPNVFYAFPEEVEALAAAGLPPAFYFTQGTIADTISPDLEVTVTSVPVDPVDLCSLIPAG
jgi:hypothetical protein